MHRFAVVAALAAALAAGCGGGGGARGVFAEMVSNFGKIKSGTLGMALLITPRGSTGGSDFGFQLHGPFALRRSGQLPVADVAYTQIASGRRATVTVISTGTQAFVETGGKTYELPSSAVERLRSSGGGGSPSGLSQLDIGDWVKDAKRASCGEARGVDCVESDLNVVAAANDLLDLGGRLAGQEYPRLHGRSAQQLRDAVRSAKLKLATGAHDRLLRSLVIDVDLGLDVPEQLRSALGNIVGAKIHFALSVGRPNRPVHVAAPQGALPSSALPGF
jgi:hypothetical protein